MIPTTVFKPSSILNYPLLPTVQSVLPYGLLPPPMISTYSVPDLNSDPYLREKVSEYFYRKVYNNWLKYQYLDLYKLVIVNNGVAALSKNDVAALSKNEENSSDNEIKYKFIIKNFLSKKDIYTLLEKFRKIYDINWWELEEKSDKIKKFIYHKVKKYITYNTMNELKNSSI